MRTLEGKTFDADLLREMIGFAAQRMMELEVEIRPERPMGTRALSVWRSATATVTKPKIRFLPNISAPLNAK
jgi:hypothetical protein